MIDKDISYEIGILFMIMLWITCSKQWSTSSVDFVQSKGAFASNSFVFAIGWISNFLEEKLLVDLAFIMSSLVLLLRWAELIGRPRYLALDGRISSFYFFEDVVLHWNAFWLQVLFCTVSLWYFMVVVEELDCAIWIHFEHLCVDLVVEDALA